MLERIPPEDPAPPPSGPKPEGPEPPDTPDDGDGDDGEPRPRLVIKLADGKERAIQYIHATTYWGPDGRPMTAQQFLERLFGDLSALVASEEELRRTWSDPDQREHFKAVLEQRGYDADKLAEMRRLIDAPNSDLFDVLSYIRFTTPPRTRADRAEAARGEGISAVDTEMRAFLLGILKAYEDRGEGELATPKLAGFLIARYGSLADAKTALGEVPAIRQAFVGIQRELYRQ